MWQIFAERVTYSDLYIRRYHHLFLCIQSYYRLGPFLVSGKLSVIL